MYSLSHSRRSTHTALAIICLLACVPLVSAQVKQEKKEEKKEEQTATIRVDTELVSVDVTVTDRTGARNVPMLRAEDFVIY